MATKTTYQIVLTDGTILNWGFPTREQSEKDLASGRYDSKITHENAAYVREHTYEVTPAPYEQVMIDAEIPADHRIALLTDMQRFLNSTPDAGRPSDAMRSAVRSYKRDPDSYIEKYKTGTGRFAPIR
jgi:hypothetical protein